MCQPNPQKSWSGIGLALTTVILLTVLPVLHILASHRTDLPLLIGDPARVALGGLFARRCTSAWKFVLVPATAWLIVNIVSPHSMSIQQFLFGR